MPPVPSAISSDSPDRHSAWPPRLYHRMEFEMVTSMPVPLNFRLPDGWTPARPDDVGAPGAAFVALRTASQGPGFTTNITIDGGHRSDEVELPTIADESVQQLADAGSQVSVLKRTEVGDAESPGLTQLLKIVTMTGDEVQDLTQCQVYLEMPDVHQPQHRAVVRLVLTAPAEEIDGLLPQFQLFVDSVRSKN
ncbi:hypothetical protein [Saccharopolyspora sp.]|uniref:hypothetical protein n=1 Tax=Saccharopolyspora sp. TaxID=33915 RepID=UPI0025E2E110|nr:hypothetical protein [Saccharopolyspora sp.]